jgi:hypothetical protein
MFWFERCISWIFSFLFLFLFLNKCVEYDWFFSSMLCLFSPSIFDTSSHFFFYFFFFFSFPPMINASKGLYRDRILIGYTRDVSSERKRKKNRSSLSFFLWYPLNDLMTYFMSQGLHLSHQLISWSRRFFSIIINNISIVEDHLPFEQG